MIATRKSGLVRVVTPMAGVCFFTVLLFAFPVQCADGIRRGLVLCAGSVIPSLFPFMVLSSFVVRSGLSGMTSRFFSPVTRGMFRLPGSAAAAIIMGLIGGYPVGARMIAALYEQGELSEKDAHRMLLFCVGAGPAFIISGVGAGMLNSSSAGLILFGAVTLAALTMGIVAGFFAEKQPVVSVPQRKDNQPRLIDAYVLSVSDAASGMLSVCSWVILFSAVVGIVQTLSLSENPSVLITGLLEVVNGCTAASNMGLPVIAAILGWAGISVQCQALPFVLKTGMNPVKFILGRLIHAAISFLYCLLLLQIFPSAVSVFSRAPDISPSLTSATISVTIGLIVMSALLILEVDKTRKMC